MRKLVEYEVAVSEKRWTRESEKYAVEEVACLVVNDRTKRNGNGIRM